MKHQWFLHKKEWNERGGVPKNGTNLFVVCPQLNVSLELSTCVGYGSCFQTLSGAINTALKEACKKAAAYEERPVMDDRYHNEIIGELAYANAL